MDPRSTGCIALLPTGNKNGSVLFYSLATGKVITRDHITPSNLQHVSTSLGLSKKMKWASSQEIYVVGWFGLSIFSILVLYSTILLYFSPKILLPRLFFISIILSSVLDLPRYIFMVIDREYTSIVAYACHILSNYFFFLSLTLVCVVWAHLLQFGSYTSFIYRGRGVILTNFILAIISIISFLYCLKSTSLEQFLDSTVYSIYRGVEVIENLFYSIVVAFFGIKLVIRFIGASFSSFTLVDSKIMLQVIKKISFKPTPFGKH